ncbi:hypothetical protein T11_18271 [Trichinella zimbabwensis]|uniref:Uncharacterized protein n=1 Tax=Trichinella zimbabwensis TaxID=268475 RepID=A0A0V1I4I8_9BILA|nr:hypothetical protein T11_18271 [Trichinella zimbabwensis]
MVLANSGLVADLPAFLRFLQEQVLMSEAAEGSREFTPKGDRSTLSMDYRKRIKTRGATAFYYTSVENSFPSAGRNTQSPSARFCERQALGRDEEWRDDTACVSTVLSPGTVRQSVRADTEIRDHLWARRRLLSQKGRHQATRLQTIMARANGALGLGEHIGALLHQAGCHKSTRFGREGTSSVSCGYRQSSLQLVKFWFCRTDRKKNTERYLLEALIMPKLCNDLYIADVSAADWEHARFLELVADEGNDKEEIHVAIGVDNYCRFLGNAI